MVYDDPNDTTLKIAEPLAKKDKRLILTLNESKGVAFAVRTGFKKVTAEAVMVTAIDLPEDIKKLDEMLNIFYNGNYAIVSPSRYMTGGERHAGKFLNQTLSRFGNVALYYIAGLPIHDATNGSKLYRKAFLDSIEIKTENGWVVALEITIKAFSGGWSMTEIPTTQRERERGSSKFKLFKWLKLYIYWFLVALKEHIKKWIF